jgi:hypothetical protein
MKLNGQLHSQVALSPRKALKILSRLGGLCMTYKTGFFYWMIGFIDTLYTVLGTTGNYSAIADPHTLQFTVSTRTRILSLH